jgi:hypothetical protein
MTVSLRKLTDDDRWLAEIANTKNPDEVILIGANGKVVLRNYVFGEDTELWPGWEDDELIESLEQLAEEERRNES